MHTSIVIGKYVLETYMPNTFVIYAKYLIDFYGRNIHIYMHHIYSHCIQPYDNGHWIYKCDTYHWTNMAVVAHIIAELPL